MKVMENAKTQKVIIDKFEDNPKLEGKEMHFHKKPGRKQPPTGGSGGHGDGGIQKPKTKTTRDLLLEFIAKQEKFNNEIRGFIKETSIRLNKLEK